MDHPTRLPDWRRRFDLWLAGVSRTPPSDCVLLVGLLVDALRGTTHVADWQDRYDGIEDGRVLLRAEGYADHIALVDAHLIRVPVEAARAGDLVQLTEGEDAALGAVIGARDLTLHLTGDMDAPRVGMSPTANAIAAWAV